MHSSVVLVRSNVGSITGSSTGSVTLIELNKESRGDVRLITGASAGLIALTKSNEESKGAMRSSADHVRSSTYACKVQSRRMGLRGRSFACCPRKSMVEFLSFYKQLGLLYMLS